MNFSAMVRHLVATLAALTLTAAVTGPASAQSPPPSAEAGFTVTTAAQYRNALTTLSADDSGPHTVTVGADIVLAADNEPTYTGTQPLTIDGQGFTVDGNDLNRALDAKGSTAPVTIEDLEVVNGDADDQGGAVATGGPLTIRDSTFTDNAAAFSGGAVYAEDDLTVERSQFSANGAGSGGAGFTYGGDISVTDSTFTANHAGNSGALRADEFFTGGGVTILRSSFIENEADTTNAGAVWASNDAVITDSTFFGNTTGGDGGALFGLWIDATNSTFAENRADTGGAIAVSDALDPSVALDHVTLTDGATGSLVAAIDPLDPYALTSRASVFDGRGQPSCEGVGATTSLGHNLDQSEDDSCGLDDPTDLQAARARLGPVRDNGGPTETSFPLSGSELVDAIPAADCGQALDQRGVARPFGAACDIGAVERAYAPHGFTDVPPWVEEAVRWMASTVNDPQLMTGVTPTSFKPNDPITRGQVVRLLHREAGSPDVSGYPPHGFVDVGEWIEDAVRWAKAEEIAVGVTPTAFKPNLPITRGQVVRMKYRLAGSPDVSQVADPPFTDVPDWIADAVRWAADPDYPVPLVTGITPTQFKPNDGITRAQVARMDYRLALTRAAWDQSVDLPATLPLVGRAGPQLS